MFPFDPKNEQQKIEVRRQAQEVLKQAKEKPEAFETLANKYSKSADKGTIIQVKRGGVGGVFEHTAFTLALNDISPVVETPKGFEIIKLVNKKEPVFKPLEKVKDQLLKSLKQEKFAAEFNKTAQRVISQASDLPDVFTKFIAERKGKESTLENVTRDGSVLKERIFGLARKGDKGFLEEEGKGVIVELTAIAPSVFPSLAAVKEKVTQDIHNEKARKALEADIQSLRARMKEKKQSLQDVAASASVKGEYAVTDWVDPQNPSTVRKLDEKKLPAQKMVALTKVHATTQAVTPDAGYIAELLEIDPFNQADFEKKKPALELQVRQEEAAPLQRSFIDALRSRAKVEINKDLIRYGARG